MLCGVEAGEFLLGLLRELGGVDDLNRNEEIREKAKWLTRSWRRIKDNKITSSADGQRQIGKYAKPFRMLWCKNCEILDARKFFKNKGIQFMLSL